MAIGKQVSDANGDGTCLGQSATDKISFYAATPVVQRASAVQAAVSTSAVALATGSQFGFSTSAQGNGIIATLNEIVATLTALGLWKGGA